MLLAVACLRLLFLVLRFVGSDRLLVADGHLDVRSAISTGRLVVRRQLRQNVQLLFDVGQIVAVSFLLLLRLLLLLSQRRCFLLLCRRCCLHNHVHWLARLDPLERLLDGLDALEHFAERSLAAVRSVGELAGRVSIGRLAA